MSDNRPAFTKQAPTPTLPRKRERNVLVSSTSTFRERASSLSRLRGRVARSSERDGWGLFAQRIQLPDSRSVRVPQTVRND
jgi:hypothetical protein